MQEQIFLYSIVLYFFIACQQGYKHGATYEAISMLSFFIGTILSTLVYSDALINKSLSLIMFVAIYFLGQFLSFLCKRKSKIEQILGIVLGAFKYISHMLALNVILILSNADVHSYNENIFSKYSQPIAEYIAQHIEQYINR